MFLLVTLTSDRSSSSLICFAQEQHKNSNKHTQTDIRLMAFFQDDLGKPVPQKGWANLDFDEARGDGVAVASAGPYASHLHLVADRQPLQHLITQYFTDWMLFLTPNQ